MQKTIALMAAAILISLSVTSCEEPASAPAAEAHDTASTEPVRREPDRGEPVGLPVVEGGSASAMAIAWEGPLSRVMYQHCSNRVNFHLPASLKEIKVASADAKVTPVGNGYSFMVMPTGKSCKVRITGVSTQGGADLVQEETFTVVPPPLPRLELEVNGIPYDGMKPVNKKATVILRAKPDALFADRFYKDCRYVVARVEVLSQRSLGAPTTVDTHSGNGKDFVKGITVELGNSLKQDPPGTKVMVKAMKVYRINSEGKQYLLELPPMGDMVGFVIK